MGEKDKLDELLEAEERKEEADANEEEEDLSSVLKEGRKIGDSYYLVEMSTDGRTLTISAYDGDTQQTLELLINEKNHRKLHRVRRGLFGARAAAGGRRRPALAVARAGIS